MMTGHEGLATLDVVARRHGWRTWLEANDEKLTAIGLIRPKAAFPSHIVSFDGGLHSEEFEYALDECMDFATGELA